MFWTQPQSPWTLNIIRYINLGFFSLIVLGIFHFRNVAYTGNSLQIHYGTLYLVTSWGNFALITLRICLTLRSDYVRKPVLRRTTRSVNDTNPLLADSDEDKNRESNHEVRMNLLWWYFYKMHLLKYLPWFAIKVIQIDWTFWNAIVIIILNICNPHFRIFVRKKGQQLGQQSHTPG